MARSFSQEHIKLGILSIFSVFMFCHVMLWSFVNYGNFENEEKLKNPDELVQVEKDVQIMKKFLWHIESKKDLYSAYFSLPSVPGIVKEASSENATKPLECVLLTPFYQTDLNVIITASSFLSKQLKFEFNNISTSAKTASVSDELKIVQSIFDGKWNSRVLLLENHAFVDFGRFSVPMHLQCNQVTFVQDPMGSLMKHENLDNFPLENTLICQFCGKIIEYCGAKKAKDISSDEMWILQQIARYNIENHFSVVGLKENIKSSLKLLQNYLPRFFSGAAQFFERLNLQEEKITPFEEFMKKLKNLNVKALNHPVILQDYDLYQFVVQRFHAQLLSLKRQG